MLSPAVAVLAVLSVVPLSQALYSSFRQVSPLLPPKFIGLGNYTAVIESENFLAAWRVTLLFTVITVVLTTSLAMISASALHGFFRGSAVVKPLVLLPWAVPGVLAGVIWRWMFNNDWGAINTILHALGVIRSVDAPARQVVFALNLRRAAHELLLLFSVGNAVRDDNRPDTT